MKEASPKSPHIGMQCSEKANLYRHKTVVVGYSWEGGRWDGGSIIAKGHIFFLSDESVLKLMEVMAAQL